MLGFYLMPAPSPTPIDDPYYNGAHRHFLRQRSRGDWALNAKKRLFGNLLNPDFQAGNLPQAPIISQLPMGRHCYRGLSGAAMKKIISSLPHLRVFKYQCLAGVDRNDLIARDTASKTIFETLIYMPRVRRVAFWEGISGSMNSSAREYKSVNPILLLVAVKASYRLEHFSICHAIDATDFFQSHHLLAGLRDPYTMRPYGWPHLAFLALTTHIGRLRSNPVEVNRLILAAGNAASLMPKLQIMEVFTPGIREGFFFRYEVRDDGITRLFIAATWRLQILTEAVRPWRQVAERHAPSRFVCQVESIRNPEALTSHWSICSKLRLYRMMREQ
ncbi:hypothetical protein LX36DRAFT_35555 [Colletotrichum falcatum]|nr:hypothetical protein LX36DRAFT_35555 [Colletotrichum falcatum]